MSRYKILFSKPTERVPLNNQKEMNSFIHRSVGHNEFHDTFSAYNISNLQGGKYDKESDQLVFSETPYIYISSPNEEFVVLLLDKINERKQRVFGMVCESIEFVGMEFGWEYDYIRTVSPIIVFDKKNSKKITFEDDNWLDILKQNCVDKLRYQGIIDPTFAIEVSDTNRWKTKRVWVGEVYSYCSMIRLKVYGHKRTRKILYELGLGGSCGSGFGCVKICKRIETQ